MKYLLLLISILSININAQKIFFSTDSLNLQMITVKTDTIVSLQLNNSTEQNLNVIIKNSTSAFKVLDSIINIPSKNSSVVRIKFSPLTNVVYNDFIFAYTEDSTSAAICKLVGSGKFTDIYQNITFNLYDTQLKSALSNYVTGHTSLGYNSARDQIFYNIDDFNNDDSLECVYTGRKIKVISRTDAQTNGNFNTEHTWPQSKFSESEPMRSDINHLFPTDENANNRRSSYPFDNVTSVTWQEGGSKLGTANGRTAFEPRDVHKGEVARAMLYFILRYPTNYGGFLDAAQETVFRAWNIKDTVAAKDIIRNNRVQAVQGKRNPLIDHPEFVDRIYSFITSATRPGVKNVNLYPKKLLSDSTEVGDTSEVNVYLYNLGTEKLAITTSIQGTTSFVIESLPDTLYPNKTYVGKILFIPKASDGNSGRLQINSTAGIFFYNLTGNAVVAPNSVENENAVKDFVVYQNYPNPFNASTNLSYTLPYSSNVKISVYDVIGKEVSVLVNQIQSEGNHNVYFNAGNLPSSTYFFKIEAGTKVFIKKILLMK